MTNPNIFGQPVVFNEEVKFFKDIHIYGTLYYEFESNTKEKFGDIFGTYEYDGMKKNILITGGRVRRIDEKRKKFYSLLNRFNFSLF